MSSVHVTVTVPVAQDLCRSHQACHVAFVCAELSALSQLSLCIYRILLLHEYGAARDEEVASHEKIHDAGLGDPICPRSRTLDSEPLHVLVYDAPWYRPLIVPGQAIVHPVPNTRVCNANQVLVFSCCSLVWRHPPIYVLWV